MDTKRVAVGYMMSDRNYECKDESNVKKRNLKGRHIGR